MGDRTIDFFLLSSDLAPLDKSCEVVQDAQTRPHWPVPLVRTLKSPKAFPQESVVGPARSNDHWSAADHTVIANMYSVWANCAEVELCGLFDVAGETAEAYKGGGSQPSFRLI